MALTNQPSRRVAYLAIGEHDLLDLLHTMHTNGWCKVNLDGFPQDAKIEAVFPSYLRKQWLVRFTSETLPEHEEGQEIPVVGTMRCVLESFACESDVLQAAVDYVAVNKRPKSSSVCAEAQDAKREEPARKKNYWED